MDIDEKLDKLITHIYVAGRLSTLNNPLPKNGHPKNNTELDTSYFRNQIKEVFEEKTDDNFEKMQKIKNWCRAYPLDIFPEPDFKKAAKALKENGMTLDAISASNMRHVVTGIQKIIDGEL